MKPPLVGYSDDDYQTPCEALEPLFPFLKSGWVLWECAQGLGNLSQGLRDRGYSVVGSDIHSGEDFLRWQPERWDCAITNPPFSIKQKFLIRAYELGKPFAFLLPLTTLETRVRQDLFKRYGIEIILFDARINFEKPGLSDTKSWFSTAWFTSGLNIGQQLSFAKLTRGQLTMTELHVG